MNFKSKTNKINLLFIGVTAFALGACSDKDLENEGNFGVLEGQKTSAVISINLKTDPVAVRATTSTSIEGENTYNTKGTYTPTTETYKTADVYVVGTGRYSNDAVVHKQFDLTTTATPAYNKNNGSFVPQQPAVFEVNSGRKQVFVVLNQLDVIKKHLWGTEASGSIKTTVPTSLDFREKYIYTPLVLENSAKKDNATDLGASITTGAATTPIKTSVEQLMEINNTTGSTNELKLTYFSDKITSEDVKPNIKKETIVSSSSENWFARDLRRSVARAFVTCRETKKTIAGLGTFYFVNYSIGQGGNSLYLADRDTVVNGQNYKKTPDFNYVSTASNYNVNGTDAGAYQYYDYSTLWKTYPISPLNATTAASPTAQEIGSASEKNAYFIATSHNNGASRENSDYKKGNTAYALIRCIFVPEKFEDNTSTIGGSITITPFMPGPEISINLSTSSLLTTETLATRTSGSGSAGAVSAPGGSGVVNESDLASSLKDAKLTFYYGENGKFYHTYESSQDPTKGGVAGQVVSKYENGKVLYLVWLNPNNNNIADIYASPTVRNNIYHIDISAVAKIGYNYNPLVPNPTGKDEYNNPNNPDKCPDVDNTTPKKPQLPIPVKPEDPLSNNKTYMAVECKTMPWQTHSYSVTLGED